METPLSIDRVEDTSRLPDFDQVSIGIAHVAPDLAATILWRSQEWGTGRLQSS